MRLVRTGRASNGQELYKVERDGLYIPTAYGAFKVSAGDTVYEAISLRCFWVPQNDPAIGGVLSGKPITCRATANDESRGTC